MRNLLIFMFLVAIFVLGKRSCHFDHFGFGGISGSGPVQTETRSVSGFHAIEMDISGDVEVTIGENYAVEVMAQQNILPILKTEVENGALRIYTNESIYNAEGIKIKVTAPAFDAFSVAGSGTLRVINAIHADKMTMEIAGSGDIFCPQSDFGILTTSIAGSGSVELSGKVNDMHSEISGSGDVKAKGLTVNTLRVEIAGSGTVTADVTTELKAEISGSGDVFYSGTPTVNTDISGSGSVKKIEAQ